MDKHREVDGLQQVYWLDDSFVWHGGLIPTPGGEFDGWSPDRLPGRGLEILARSYTWDCNYIASPALGNPIVWRVLFLAEKFNWECIFGWESTGNSHREDAEY